MTAFTWYDGRPITHLGNVAEYNEQFLDPATDDTIRRQWRTEGHHYANLAMFYSPQPAVVVLPGHVDRSWTERLVRQLDWEPVEVYSGIAGDTDLSQAVGQRPALVARIASTAVLPWGRTPRFDSVFAAAGQPPPAPDVLAAVRHFDSKAVTNALFARLAADRCGVVVPRQWTVRTRRAAIRGVTAMAASGRTVVLKAEHGVGGQGTAVLTPDTVARAGGPRALLHRMLPRDWFRRRGCLLLEQYVEGGAVKDLTYDGFVDDHGAVRTVGTGAMIIDGTRYRGVTVGPGAVPARLDEVIRGFGPAVGQALAAHGYRGWFDVDFVADRTGRVAPTEVNTRHTGPTAAFAIQSRLDRVRGGRHVVRTLDRLPLGARLPDEALSDHMRQLARDCSAGGAELLTTVPTASYEPQPYVGVALAARSLSSLDEAERLIRRANEALADRFIDLLRRPVS